MCIDCPETLTRRAALTGGASFVLATSSKAAEPGEAVSIAVNGGAAPARLFRADRKRAPAIVTAHGNPGFDADYMRFCARIAARGFNVLAVDWTTHAPPVPAERAKFPDWRRETLGNARFWEKGSDALDAGSDWMRSRRLAHGKSVSGFRICGGGVVMGVWSVRNPSIDRMVFFHAPAKQETERNEETPASNLIDLTSGISARIQAHCGVIDRVAKVEDSRAFEAALVRAKRNPDFHYYDRAGHGFLLDGVSFDPKTAFGYVESASEHSIARAIEFVG